MGRKAEERENRRERNRKFLKAAWQAVGIIMLFDLLMLFTALLSYDATVVKYTLLFAAVLLPLNIELFTRNMDAPSSWPFF